MSNKVYYPQILNEQDLPDKIDYLIITANTGDNDRKMEQLYDKINSDDAKEITLVASCVEPSLSVYKIITLK